ncbi:MAG: Adenosine monophosphate-protein transferase VbhT [Candidatus Ordinivivax streblomastigis]|uniref:protein adenylyltransferase n=1 Tax=Candidatus Ordinivivax streblomastigis TaxID=2540710 RepID=A0A5M8P466_9BACT|nr:MAG: Adenosine monophosphate-protein transferase VbhT [Candidatus Ordinivivax streblomastigis]KAA6303394.1 MAG: Adenosine monophosphate-protein transferase VbhT [Candidatus Ordinivivax streblomastigis]
MEISKNGKQFFPTSRFDTAFSHIDNLITEYKLLEKHNKSGIAQKLAEILDAINFLHPFREGNGRTQREFIRLLTLEKGYILNLNPADNVDIYERYMQGTIDSDIKKLSQLIYELI